MNDPKRPYHAISYYDAFGDPPFINNLPREEEDFSSRAKAEKWLRERGGGTIDKCLDGYRFERIASILPEGGDSPRVLSA